MRQVQAQIELQLVVVRRQVRAQLVEGLVVLGFPEVRQLTHHDHLQEVRGRVGETLEKDGVLVERNGVMVANLPCSGTPPGELGPDWFERMGIAAAGEEFQFPE
jgi:hypothetical protein